METHHQTRKKSAQQQLTRGCSWLLILPIRAYQYLLSPWIGHHCRFQPTCSHYAIEAIERFGAVKGSAMALRRLSKCHPWHAGGCDPVPLNSNSTHKDG